jgi:uncharacterized protein YbjT (DUF2867 family)
MQTILVTGATGTIGANVVSELVKLGNVKVRVATRDVKKAPAGAEAVDFDWDKPDSIAAAVKGADAVFLLTPFVENPVPYAKALVDAARAAGVKKIVKLSAAGADNPTFPAIKHHTDAEQLVEASGAKWVHLRPNFFMTNFIGYYPPDAEGMIYMPTGNGKVSWIDPRDIGEVAARVLTRPDWDNRALSLDGGEALSAGDVAQAIADATGRTIRYVDVPEAAARSAMEGMKLPAWMIDSMMSLHNVIKQGWAAGTSTAVEDVTGHAPRTFAAFAKENASIWKK